MKVIVLAAGLGNRLEERTKDIPKALVQVAEKCLIDRVFDFIDHKEVTEIAVVGGYCFDRLKDHLKDHNIKLFFNPKFEQGNIFTLKSALDFMDNDTLIMNVDHIYLKEMFDHILSNTKGITAICDFDRNLAPDDMKIKLDENKKLKKISKTLKDYDAGYIGMTYISKDMINRYKEGVDQTIDIYGPSSCVEFVLGHLAANNIEINICDTSGFKWQEVDTGEDLKRAEAELLQKGQSQG